MDNLFSKIISTIRRSFKGPLICWRFYVVSAKEAIVMVSIDMGVSFLHRRLSGPFLGVDDMEPASNHFFTSWFSTRCTWPGTCRKQRGLQRQQHHGGCWHQHPSSCS